MFPDDAHDPPEVSRVQVRLATAVRVHENGVAEGSH